MLPKMAITGSRALKMSNLANEASSLILYEPMFYRKKRMRFSNFKTAVIITYIYQEVIVFNVVHTKLFHEVRLESTD